MGKLTATTYTAGLVLFLIVLSTFGFVWMAKTTTKVVPYTAQLTWDAPGGISNFNVYSQKGDVLTRIGNTNTPSYLYTITQAGTYRFYVKGVTALGNETAASNVAVLTVRAAPK